MYSYGMIGNCQISALVSKSGSLDWLCMPQPDSAPVFGSLLDPDGGRFSISGAWGGDGSSRQYYMENSNVLVTELESPSGDAFRIVDFCPRFEQFGRMFRPIMVVRIVEPLRGTPQIRVCCGPVAGWSKERLKPVRGSNHLRFDGSVEDALRLTTNMPLTYLCEEESFVLKDRLFFVLTQGSPVEEDLAQVSQRFLEQTLGYWRTWVKHCSIPSLFQKETIRSALTLKLHCYEDTGAILAALTTSLPEEEGGARNWDYRYCWLRDAYFVLSALHNLGHFEEMEGFLKFLLGIAQRQEASSGRLSPVYTLGQALPLPEEVFPHWRGHADSRPVRARNQAAEHVQNDVYGEMILTLSPIFFDERFVHLRHREHESLLLHLAHQCAQSISVPDAGLWEVRNGWQEHSFTNLLCWAGLERVSRLAAGSFSGRFAFDVCGARDRAFHAVRGAMVDGSLRNGPKDRSFDSSLALASILRFPDRELCLSTLRELQTKLAAGTTGIEKSFFYRYSRPDDFGVPQSAFLICSFWIAQALAQLGQREDALEIFKGALESANHVGLMAEHFDPLRRRQLGNFPQAYSHVGLINAAFAVSPPWSEVL